MDGWVDGWMEVKPGLRDCLAKSKNKIKKKERKKCSIILLGTIS
jgi:hypothetical protein